jgi:hypothetical protein
MYFYKAEFSPVMELIYTGYWNEEKFNKINWETSTVDLTPLPSRIAGRLLDSVSKQGIHQGSVSLTLNKKINQGNGNYFTLNSIFNSLYMFTDTAGYFEYLNNITDENQQYNLSFSKAGYLQNPTRVQ